jgi:hypothetical protein
MVVLRTWKQVAVAVALDFFILWLLITLSGFIADHISR